MLKNTKDTILRKINFHLKRWKGDYDFLRKDVKIRKKWLGNHYGGFNVATDFLNKDSVVYSFGIGQDVSFDLAVIEQTNAQVFGFDPTPISVNWVKEQKFPENFKFYDIGISDKSGKQIFHFLKNVNFVAGKHVDEDTTIENETSVEVKTLDDIAKSLGHKKINLVKMDIEGSEYAVIENIAKSNLEIDQILIEFHDRFYRNQPQKSKHSINLLKEKGYLIFAVSDTFDEISFIHKNVIKK